MSHTKQVTVSGGFHKADEITIRAKVDPRGGIKLSQGQAKRLGNHMCGVKGCICGMHHGWLVSGVSRNDLSEALADAGADAYLNSSRNR
jgi:hypothetical protein